MLFSVVSKTPIDLKGRWVNELGSTMEVQSISGNSFSGIYRSKVSDTKAPVDGVLSGTIAKDTIGFVVNWEPTFESVTSWSGKVLATQTGTPYIYTLWQLSRGVPNAADWWQSFLAGSDTFFRQV
jgi:hypothetical protein